MIVAGLILAVLGGFWAGWRCKPLGLSDAQFEALLDSAHDFLQGESDGSHG